MKRLEAAGIGLAVATVLGLKLYSGEQVRNSGDRELMGVARVLPQENDLNGVTQSDLGSDLSMGMDGGTVPPNINTFDFKD